MSETALLLNKPPPVSKCEAAANRGACCCNCKHHIQDFYHCTTVIRPPGMGCVCSQPKGWICMPPEFEGAAFSGWSEHGLCELHEPKGAKKKVPNRAAGGNARAIKLTPERRKEIALTAAAARWKKPAAP